jgi:hypothetical protein
VPSTLWLFLPVLGAAITHAPILKFDLFRRLAEPLDGGATIRGRRILGDNKTWRGAMAMFTGVFLATLILARTAWWSWIPLEVSSRSPLLVGALLGIGTPLGELPNSFMKRQLAIDPGTQQRSIAGVAISIFDQGDFVVGIWLALLPIARLSLRDTAIAFVAVVAVHSIVNVIGYAIGARKTWI